VECGASTPLDVVLDERDVMALEEHRIGRRADDAADREQKLVVRSGVIPRSDVHFIDTVCHPTKERQSAATDLAPPRRRHRRRRAATTRVSWWRPAGGTVGACIVQTEWNSARMVPRAAAVAFTAGTSTPVRSSIASTAHPGAQPEDARETPRAPAPAG
jgi:hypothetical protein